MANDKWEGTVKGSIVDGVVRGVIEGVVLPPTGGGGGGGGNLVYDEFTDADSTALASHTPNTDSVGGGWVVIDGTWDIQSNRANGAKGAGSQVGCYIDAGAADVTIDCVVRPLGAGTIGIRVRCSTDGSKYWLINVNSANNFDIYEYNAGFTLRASSTPTINQDQDYAVQVIASGSTITATLDGANQIQYTSATMNQAVTTHGLHSNMNATSFDNFTVA